MGLKQYVSRYEGVYIPLPKELWDTRNNVKALKFKSSEGSILKVEREDWQEVIEGKPLVENGKVVKRIEIVNETIDGKVVPKEVKKIVYERQPNRYWKTGVITILPTPEQLKAIALKNELQKNADLIKELIQMGIKLPDDSNTDAEIRGFAKKIGIPTSDADGNKIKKVELVGAIWSAFNLEYTVSKDAVKSASKKVENKTEETESV